MTRLTGVYPPDSKLVLWLIKVFGLHVCGAKHAIEVNLLSAAKYDQTCDIGYHEGLFVSGSSEMFLVFDLLGSRFAR